MTQLYGVKIGGKVHMVTKGVALRKKAELEKAKTDKKAEKEAKTKEEKTNKDERKDTIAELKKLKVDFKGNDKTVNLVKLLKEVNKEKTNS